MNLILTSGFPTCAPPEVVERMKAAGPRPRIAWIAPDTAGARSHFAAAEARFRELGFDELEACDIDREKDEVQLAYLHEFDIVYLSGGDAVVFRYNMLRAGLGGRLRQAVAAGRLIVAAGSGAQLLTPNVSLARLHTESFDEVIAARERFEGLSAVPFELLPHVDRHDAAFLEQVRRYSEHAPHDIIGLTEGGALLYGDGDTFTRVGTLSYFRNGQPSTEP